MSTINVNGKSVRVNGNLSLINGKWFVNGSEVDINALAEKQEQEQQVTITINLAEGSFIEHLDIDTCKHIVINGTCKRVKTGMGDIEIHGNVDGDVHTNMGSIECGNVGGDAHSNIGSVTYRRERYE
jgi:hypothetical protein